MSRTVEDRIAAAATEQHGVVARGQLLAAGLSPSGVKRRLRARRLRALHRGVYLTVPLVLPHSRDMAAVLASGPGAVLSHVSAAALWGLRAAANGDEPVDVSVPGDRGRRRGIRAHRIEPLLPDERTVRAGIPVTAPARTLLNLATASGRSELEIAVARAEREGLVHVGELEALLARRGGHAGSRALRDVLDTAGGPALTRSAAEARFLALVRDARLPSPEANVSVGRYEIDFLWRPAGIAVEIDGFRYHGTRLDFERDRRRDAELLAAGIAVVRLTWRQLTEEPLATIAQLAQALARAGAKVR